MTPIRSDRSWSFDVGPDQLWDAIASTHAYERWWPWLRRFDAARGLEPGETWRCEVSPPLPYVVRFGLHLDHVEPAREVRARVTGDIVGSARLSVDGAEAAGSTARLRSSLRPANPLLRSFGAVARPLVVWGHDWVLDTGLRQFVTRALEPTS